MVQEIILNACSRTSLGLQKLNGVGKSTHKFFFFLNHTKNKTINGHKFEQIYGIIYGEEKKSKRVTHHTSSNLIYITYKGSKVESRTKKTVGRFLTGVL